MTTHAFVVSYREIGTIAFVCVQLNEKAEGNCKDVYK